MSNGPSSARTRSQRVAALDLPPSAAERVMDSLKRRDVLWRLGACLVSAIALWLVTVGWDPAFPFRTGYTPQRDITARLDFTRPDKEATDAAKRRARREMRCIYANDAQPLVELRLALKNAVVQVLRAESYAELDHEIWETFWDEPEMDSSQLAIQQESQFEKFRAALVEDKELNSFAEAVASALSEFEEFGLLKTLEHDSEEGSQTEIRVHPVGNPDFQRTREVSRVLLGAETEARLRDNLQRELRAIVPEKETLGVVADRVATWLIPQLRERPTLTLNPLTYKVSAETVNAVPEVPDHIQQGQQIAAGGEPLDASAMEILRHEHNAWLAERTAAQWTLRSLIVLAMYITLFALGGLYVYYQETWLLKDVRKLALLLVLVVTTVGLCFWLSLDQWRAELVPLILMGMIATIVYGRELALVLAVAVSLATTLSLSHGIPEFVVLATSSTSAIFITGPIRNRTRLIYVGCAVAAVASLAFLGAGYLAGQPFGPVLWWSTSWLALCAIMSGVLMTGMLPFVESTFDVQTELSLLELGDAAHPLLQELVRRAPGTYNHSINVASMAEAAAESIGANGLLVRVGAYFHDIGKMLKPGYFVENQAHGDNRHDSLHPAMSTLVIIAHVKDGADLARKHGLPQSVIDFIQQHHGTTLVEFFYKQASKQSEEDPDAASVDENNFRYPGPRPQTREAGVMMLADAVESACRSLVEPTPSRIESLVSEIAQKRLLDGQFDECGLTLQELRTIEESLTKSLTAVYHGRVKYPDQRTA